MHEDGLPDDDRVHDGIAGELAALRDAGRTIRDREVVDVSLRGATLDRLRADGLILRDVDLREAVLSETDWVGCTIEGVRLVGAVARGACLRMCTLERVDATRCDLSGTKLEDSQAPGIVLERAILDGGSLVETDLTRACLRGASLRDVDATAAVLRGADLRGADLRGANVAEADLRGADLRGAKLDGCDLGDADLRGALRDDEDEVPDPLAEDESPPTDALLDAVAPAVVEMLQRGNQRGVLDDASMARMLGQLGAMGADPNQAIPTPGAPLSAVIARISETGVGPLLAALQQGKGEPPPAVAGLIQSLMRDAELGEDATAEDLVVHLVELVRSQLGVE